MANPIKTVFHVHTDYSDDCNTSIEDLLATARREGVGCIAVTDHDNVDGARALAAAGPDLRVIVGEEISTADGHLIGLFLRDCVSPGRPVRRTAEAIREQGGLVVVPHPFNSLFGCGLRDKVHEIIDLIDVVEVANAQNLLPFADRKAAEFARCHRFPTIVGADTHHRGYLHSCHQWLGPFDGPVSFLASLRRAHSVAASHPLSYFVRTANVILRQKLRWPFPTGYGQNCPRPRPWTPPIAVPIRTD